MARERGSSAKGSTARSGVLAKYLDSGLSEPSENSNSFRFGRQSADID